MVTVSQVQKGFARFVDSEVSIAFSGWQKAIVAGTAGLLANNFHSLVNLYNRQPLIAALGVYDAEAGTIDIDKIYEAYVPQMGSDKIPIAIPKVGTIKMGKDEIDVLVRYIKEA